jgi:hypothetical protein
MAIIIILEMKIAKVEAEFKSEKHILYLLKYLSYLSGYSKIR